MRNRYYKIYIIEMYINFDSHSIIKKKKKKEKEIIHFDNNHYMLNQSIKTSAEGTLFWVSQTLSASKLTRWPLTRYRFIRFSLAYRERSQLQVDTRVGEILTVNPSLRRGNPAGPHLLTEFTFARLCSLMRHCFRANAFALCKCNQRPIWMNFPPKKPTCFPNDRLQSLKHIGTLTSN